MFLIENVLQCLIPKYNFDSKIYISAVAKYDSSSNEQRTCSKWIHIQMNLSARLVFTFICSQAWSKYLGCNLNTLLSPWFKLGWSRIKNSFGRKYYRQVQAKISTVIVWLINTVLHISLINTTVIAQIQIQIFVALILIQILIQIVIVMAVVA